MTLRRTLPGLLSPYLGQQTLTGMGLPPLVQPQQQVSVYRATHKVGWDLVREGRNYSAKLRKLTQKIVSVCDVVIKHTDSSIYVVSALSTAELHDAIRSVMDRDDRLDIDQVLGTGWISDQSGLARIEPLR